MPAIDPERLVFIDESGAKTNMTRLRGRAMQGERVYDSAPHGHWHTTTMISSIRVYGETACMTIAGPTTTEVFRAYLREVLLPTLKHGDIVIMDNLSSHKATSIETLISSVGASIQFLPAYSPDLNPIEKMWSKVKECLRSKPYAPIRPQGPPLVDESARSGRIRDAETPNQPKHHRRPESRHPHW